MLASSIIVRRVLLSLAVSCLWVVRGGWSSCPESEHITSSNSPPTAWRELLWPQPLRSGGAEVYRVGLSHRPHRAKWWLRSEQAVCS